MKARVTLASEGYGKAESKAESNSFTWYFVERVRFSRC